MSFDLFFFRTNKDISIQDMNDKIQADEDSDVLEMEFIDGEVDTEEIEALLFKAMIRANTEILEEFVAIDDSMRGVIEGYLESDDTTVPDELQEPFMMMFDMKCGEDGVVMLSMGFNADEYIQAIGQAMGMKEISENRIYLYDPQGNVIYDGATAHDGLLGSMGDASTWAEDILAELQGDSIFQPIVTTDALATLAQKHEACVWFVKEDPDGKEVQRTAIFNPAQVIQIAEMIDCVVELIDPMAVDEEEIEKQGFFDPADLHEWYKTIGGEEGETAEVPFNNLVAWCKTQGVEIDSETLSPEARRFISTIFLSNYTITPDNVMHCVMFFHMIIGMMTGAQPLIAGYDEEIDARIDAVENALRTLLQQFEDIDGFVGLIVIKSELP